MPTLEIINERFARLLRLGLYNFVRRNPEISVGPINVVRFSEFIRNLVVPTNLNLVQMKPLRGAGSASRGGGGACGCCGATTTASTATAWTGGGCWVAVGASATAVDIVRSLPFLPRVRPRLPCP